MPEKDLTDLERALAALSPAPPTFNRDALLFRAGQAAVPPRRLWPFVSLATSGVALCLAVLLSIRPGPEVVVRYVKVPAADVAPAAPAPIPLPPPTPPSVETTETGVLTVLPWLPSKSGYWQMQQQALRFGVESLPTALEYVEDVPLPSSGEAGELTAGARPALFPFEFWHKPGE